LAARNKWHGGDQSADKTRRALITKIIISIRQLMNAPGAQCVMFGNAGHTDAADSQTFGFPNLRLSGRVKPIQNTDKKILSAVNIPLMKKL